MFNLFGRKAKKENNSAGKGKDSGLENTATQLQFDILRKLHDNSGTDFNIDAVGFTEEERKEVLKAIDGFDLKVPSDLFGSSAFSADNASKAKLVVDYKCSCDAMLYWVISNCVFFQISKCQGRQKQTLVNALKKLADYQPVKKAVYTL